MAAIFQDLMKLKKSSLVEEAHVLWKLGHVFMPKKGRPLALPCFFLSVPVTQATALVPRHLKTRKGWGPYPSLTHRSQGLGDKKFLHLVFNVGGVLWPGWVSTHIGTGNSIVHCWRAWELNRVPSSHALKLMEVPLDLPFPCIVNNKTLKKPRFINDKRMNERLKVESGCILIMMTGETSWVRLFLHCHTTTRQGFSRTIKAHKTQFECLSTCVPAPKVSFVIK
jgi:hypothetical protein